MRKMIVPVLLFAAVAGCGGKSGSAEDVAALITRPKCDAYNWLDCEPEGQRGQMLCECVLQPGYDCDPLEPTIEQCNGNQPRKCVAGYWQNDGAACPNHTLC